MDRVTGYPRAGKDLSARRSGAGEATIERREGKESRSVSTAAPVQTETPLPKPEGLEGVVAASTALSHVFGEDGKLVYSVFYIHDLPVHALSA